MMNFLRKHMRVIFIITIAAFFGGIFMGFGAYLFSGPNSDMKTAATVNGHKISMQLYQSLYDSSLDMYQEVSKTSMSEEQQKELKVKTMQVLIQDELFYRQALKFGILVSDDELRNDIQNSPMFQNNGRFDPRIYHAFLGKMRLTPRQYETLRRKQISGEKLKILLGSAIKVSESEYNEALKDNPKLLMSVMLQDKANRILNEWFMKVAKSSKITSNETIFKQ